MRILFFIFFEFLDWRVDYLTPVLAVTCYFAGVYPENAGFIFSLCASGNVYVKHTNKRTHRLNDSLKTVSFFLSFELAFFGRSISDFFYYFHFFFYFRNSRRDVNQVGKIKEDDEKKKKKLKRH